jgi:hypothetical protein
MRLKDLAGFILATSTLVASVTGLITAVKAQAEVKAVDARLYQQAAEGIGDNADEVYQLKQRIAALEAAGGRR